MCVDSGPMTHQSCAGLCAPLLILTQHWTGSQRDGAVSTASPDEGHGRTAPGRQELGSRGTPLKGLGESLRMKGVWQVGECSRQRPVPK